MTTAIPTTPIHKEIWEKEYWQKCADLVERVRRGQKSGHPIPEEHWRQELGWITMQYHKKYGLFKIEKEVWSQTPTPRDGESADEFEARERAYHRRQKATAEWNAGLKDRIAYWQELSDAYDERMEREGMGD